MCHCLRNAPEDNFSVISIVACIFSRTPIACACIVTAWRSVKYRTSTFSCMTFETKTEPLSVITSGGKYACLVKMSMIVLAVLTAVGLNTG